MRSVEAAERGAVGRAALQPLTVEKQEAVGGIVDWLARGVIAHDHADRGLAVLMGRHVMSSDEVVDVVPMERPPVAQAVIAQLVRVLQPISRVLAGCSPELDELDVRVAGPGRRQASLEPDPKEARRLVCHGGVALAVR